MKKRVLILFIFSIMTGYSQIGVGTVNLNKHAMLNIESIQGTKGVLLPKITNAQQEILEITLTTNEEGLTFFNTDTDCMITWTGKLFDSICAERKAEYAVDCVNSKILGQFRQGYSITSSNYIDLDLNVTQEGPFSVSGSSNNGYYFTISGFLTTGEQTITIPAFGSPRDVGKNSITLRDNMKNTELCVFDIDVVPGTGMGTVDCAKMPLPRMIAGVAESITVQLPIHVDLDGVISFSSDENNGISFKGTQDFSSKGAATLFLISEGIPEFTGTFNYKIEDSYGNVACDLVVEVIATVVELEKPISLEVVPTSIFVEGMDLSPQQAVIGMSFTSPTSGEYGVGIRYLGGGTGDPGLRFGEVTGTVPAPNTPFNLTFRGLAGSIPNQSGSFTYEAHDLYSNISYKTVDIEINALLGSFKNPAPSCQAIFDEYNTVDNLLFDDGEYWIGSGNVKYKTQCDMVSQAEAVAQDKKAGGYTLIWSVSERNFLDTYNIGGANKFSSISDQTDWVYTAADNRSVVTTEAGIVDYHNFRIPSSEKVASRLGDRVVRMNYASSAAIENVDTDSHKAQNYGETNIAVNWVNGGEALAAGGTFSGKYAGFVFSFDASSGPYLTNFKINGVTLAGTSAIYGNDNYGWHIDVNKGNATAGIYINNMWGFYGENEHDHGNFGHCVNPTNMALGGMTKPGCNGAVAGAKSPTPGVNGNQGYVKQWWVK